MILAEIVPIIRNFLAKTIIIHRKPPAGLLQRAALRSILKGLIHGHGFQIFHKITVQYQVRIFKWCVVNKIVQLRPFIHIVSNLILHGGAVDGDQRAVCQPELHAGSIHIERAGQNSHYSRKWACPSFPPQTSDIPLSSRTASLCVLRCPCFRLLLPGWNGGHRT